MKKVTDEMLDNRPTLWGSSIHPLLTAVELGDRAEVAETLASVDEAEKASGYVHSPGKDDQFIEELISLWEEVNGKW